MHGPRFRWTTWSATVLDTYAGTAIWSVTIAVDNLQLGWSATALNIYADIIWSIGGAANNNIYWARSIIQYGQYSWGYIMQWLSFGVSSTLLTKIRRLYVVWGCCFGGIWCVSRCKIRRTYCAQIGIGEACVARFARSSIAKYCYSPYNSS